MTVRHCQFFQAGEEVPAWLLDAEPMEVSASRPMLIWNVDAHVIETERGYFVLPMATNFQGGGIISVLDGKDAAIFAASREVVLPFKFQILTPGSGGKDEENDPIAPMPIGAEG